VVGVGKAAGWGKRSNLEVTEVWCNWKKTKFGIGEGERMSRWGCRRLSEGRIDHSNEFGVVEAEKVTGRRLTRRGYADFEEIVCEAPPMEGGG
jgi:hypothetical protein